MKKWLCVYFIILTIVGCRSNNDDRSFVFTSQNIVTSDSLLTFTPPMKRGYLSFDSIVRSVRYLPLKTNDSTLIGRIDDIKILNDTIFIADYKTSQILAYNMKGDDIGLIHAVGAGPKEYKRICGFDIDSKNRLIYLLDGDLGRIHVYNTLLEFQRVIQLPYLFVDHLSLFGENMFFLDFGFREYRKDSSESPNLVLYDFEKEKTVSEFFEFENDKMRYRIQDHIAFSSYDDKLYYWTTLGHTIYECGVHKLTQRIEYDLGDYETPSFIYLKGFNEAFSMMKEKGYAYIDRFYEFRDWYYARISRRTSAAHYFYNKQTKEGFLDVSLLKMNDVSKVIYPNLFMLSDSVFCSNISPDQYLQIKSTDISINSDDNDVLVFYELK